MKEKIKFLLISDKKLKPEGIKHWKDHVERYAPDMYDTINAIGNEEGIKQVDKLRPEIIMLMGSFKDTLGLIKKIKQLHPPAAVFIFQEMVDDEQETIDEYIACGAYKCYFPPLAFDTLIHDMYVSLNLE
jgi:DNA-binding NarL/FixJ family response regulator